MAGRHTLHSGKEFSAFDLAVCRAISPPVHFDAGECLMQRLLEEPRDDDEVFAEPQPFWMAPSRLRPLLRLPPPPFFREKARVAATNPALKAVHQRRVSTAKTAALGPRAITAPTSTSPTSPGLVFRNRPRRLRPRLRRPPDPLGSPSGDSFPPGSTLLIPSALVQHSNVPIRAHEQRSSITQYTAGSLFRWYATAARRRSVSEFGVRGGEEGKSS
ncbi:hypothetical protein B0H13DRAFT_2394385 [Mycena leptocephala]|nr:hypothetical protein B0H13DRAFT_2394385 [Mycena leptocephala]